MIRIFIITLIALCGFWLAGFAPDKDGYTNYKQMGKDYAKFVFNMDTAGMLRFCNYDVWQKVTDCAKRKTGHSNSFMGDLLNTNYRRFFEALYAVPAAQLQNSFKKYGITYCLVDSVVADKDNPVARPCTDMPYFYIHIYLSYNKTEFETKVSVTQYNNRWYILYITPVLNKLKADCKN